MDLTIFKEQTLFKALQEFFKGLNIPVAHVAEEPVSPATILSATFREAHPAFGLMNRVYFLGMVDESVFSDGEAGSTLDNIRKSKEDYDGLLIFGVTLNERDGGLLPTRSQLADITRAFNREFHYTPVVVVFRYANHITFAASERLKYKQQWREGEKAGKVTMLKDINIEKEKTHSGHLRILKNMEIRRSGKKAVNSFEALYKYWQEVFDVSILNKQFYQELANWYFWAIKQVEFPDDVEKDKETRNAISVIRLITRLIFIWFIKERDLVPPDLFDENGLKNTLKGFDPEGKEKGVYYNAILQNLFFGTLNQSMDKRKFAEDGSFHENKKHYGVKNVFRYSNLFSIPEKEALKLFSTVPFLNGGLFDCLDKEDKNGKVQYVDGFSRDKKKRAFVPDYLFFGKKRPVNLSKEYDNSKKKKESVEGLICLLNSYKFTVAENTPLEEEVALDPELLGKVFENLLASYNPETKTTARKQTGSFYTPREIVNYMVDESLIAYLLNNLSGVKSADKKLRQLFSYTEEKHLFQPDEAFQLVSAINKAKILDPACGSGAFPMGILHKLVYILGKLDEKNKLWKQVQKQKAIQETEKAYNLGDKEERRQRLLDIEETFELNSSDYGRKLYLIENCIYGVDIQPIACQIAKLRFFISLIIDQQIHKDKDNYGIRPLPNLETKFVAANTLIGLDKPEEGDQLMFENEVLKKAENQLMEVRHRYFNAKTRTQKMRCQEQDKKLRAQIAELLVGDGWDNSTATQIAQWNPYDQNASAPFFDPEWMFGNKEGFDVVIGNPPYVSHDKLGEDKQYYKEHYLSYEPFADVYCYFVEKGINLQSNTGNLCYITSNSFLRTNYGKPIRRFILSVNNVIQIINIDVSQLFESAIVNTSILLSSQNRGDKQDCTVVNAEYDFNGDFNGFVSSNHFYYEQGDLCESSWTLVQPKHLKLKKIIEDNHKTLEGLGTKIRLGIATGANEVFLIDEEAKNDLIKKDKKNLQIIKPILRGRDIDRYGYVVPDLSLLLTKNGINIKKDFHAVFNYLNGCGDDFKRRGAQGQNWWNLRACAFFDDFKREKIVWIELTNKGRFALCTDEIYLLNSAYFLLPPKPFDAKYLLAILNSTLIVYYIKLIAETSGMGTTRWINNFVKDFPIPNASTATQKLFIAMVDKRISVETTVADTTDLENEIDLLVYKLYGLSYTEVMVIDTNIEAIISEKEYNKRPAIEALPPEQLQSGDGSDKKANKNGNDKPVTGLFDDGTLFEEKE